MTQPADSPSLKVVRVIARLNVGGPARHVILLDRGLSERGHRTLLVHGEVDDGEAPFDHDGMLAPGAHRKILHLGRRVSPWGDVRAFVALLRIVFSERPDVVHTHTAKAGVLGRLAAVLVNAIRPPRQRSAIIHTFHGHVFHGYFGPRTSAAVRLVERLLARMTDRVIAISPLQRTELVERFGVVPPEKAVVIPLGLDLSSLLAIDPHTPSLRSHLGIADHNIVVGFVGRMVPIKGLPVLIQAFAEATRSEPRLRLVLAGDGPLRNAVVALVQELGVADRTHLLGWVRDLPTLYATCDLVALSSLNEGTPVAVIEAMAAARPVVATRVGGVPDVVEHGATGLLVDPHDPRALAEAIVRLAADGGLRAALGAAGRARVASFSHHRLVEEVEAAYQSALAVKRGVRR